MDFFNFNNYKYYLIIFYFSHGIKPILEYIFNEMVKYGYLKKNNKFFFENNKSNPVKKKINKRNNQINKSKTIKKKKTSKKKLNLKLNESKNNQETNSIGKIKSNSSELISYIKKEKTKKSKKNISFLPTGNTNDKKENQNNDIINFSIINININNFKKITPQDSNQTLHNYTFEEAIKYDRRSIFKIFYIYLLSKQIIFHTFLQKSPLELFSLRLCLFIFMLSTDLALNSLLYLNDNISKKYKYTKGLFLFTFSNNITIILLSTLLSFILISLISKLSNSTNEIRNVFRKEEEILKKVKKYKIDEKRKMEIFLEIEKILKKFKIKIIFLIIIQIILILFYFYFVTAFCHVYSNTQKSWLLDSFLSVLSRLVIELLFALFFAKLYIIAVESNSYSLYRVLLFIYDFS